MATVPRVEFENSVLDIDLKDQRRSMDLIQNEIIQRILGDKKFLYQDNVRFRKITKNDNIKQTIDKLQKDNLKEEIQCFYSYGIHLQKMLSVIEIYKRVVKNSSTKLEQYNKLTNFVAIEEGRNVLLEKKTRIPVLIVFISAEQNKTLERDLLIQKKFTKQT
ncbi:hypothetical protein HG535_0A08500 [Zygotorulaspora mrakii]|uniref:DNA/RNA-binding protein Alba-like domain-containing protein n=1 Tax=Zygotorulaspora mrakii TaxID=42260 RepID=A0A7H9AXS4_ZYGMR|nr:uncharacterized protein HG535_0A08500 [Zygotorulaspora mrakii]QLG70904.1 hypothetical protein HG535_0A08500 [Zygotorulaspora mrakii]